VISSSDGSIPTTTIPAGIYWSEAWWDEPVTGIRYADPGSAVKIEEGVPFMRNFLLQPPPNSIRVVWAHIHMDNVNKKAVGKDWWGHPDFTTQYQHLGPDLADPVTNVEIKDGRPIDDWGSSEFKLDISLVTKEPGSADDPPQWSLRVHWQVRIKKDEDDPWRDKGTFIVPPKVDPLAGGVVVEDHLSRLDVDPVRSHIRIELHNDRA